MSICLGSSAAFHSLSGAIILTFAAPMSVDGVYVHGADMELLLYDSDNTRLGTEVLSLLSLVA